MRKPILTLFLLLFSIVALALPPESQLSYRGNVFSYYASHDLMIHQPGIERVIVTIHGSERNADTYYKSINAMAKKHGISDKTLILSPHFKMSFDTLVAKEFTWDWEGWLRGDEAQNNHQTSSFTLMDYIIGLLSSPKNFPALKEVVLTGHSAGGQFVQRYAAGTEIDKKYSFLKFRYVVTNPGSYLYLTGKRPVNPAIQCNYNDYKYGLNRLNSYMGRSSVEDIRSRYVAKEIIYFVGEDDTRSDDIDQDCPARFQGNNRLERGRLFKAQLEVEFPESRHNFYSAPGVGHTQYGMYTSEVGQKILFQKL